MRPSECGFNVEWTVDDLIGIAQSFDRAARRVKPERYASYRKLAFGARKYARTKLSRER